MGIEAKFSANEVMNAVNARKKVATRSLERDLSLASEELYKLVRDLVPYKSGTLQRSVKRKRGASKGEWRVYINDSQKVPKKERTVAQYLAKIESGNFNSIGPKSRKKEALINRYSMGQRRVERSPQGTYVGGVFFGRAVDAIVPKWEKKMEKSFRAAMEKKMARGTQNRDSSGRFAKGFTGGTG